jgi:hypothetical protein
MLTGKLLREIRSLQEKPHCVKNGKFWNSAEGENLSLFCPISGIFRQAVYFQGQNNAAIKRWKLEGQKEKEAGLFGGL